MTPLIAVVFVVAVLLTVAFYNADDVVLDNYYREGRGVNQVFEQDIRGQQLALSATLNFDRMSGEVLVDISANEALHEQLLLLMVHPVGARVGRPAYLGECQAGLAGTG